MAQSLNIPYLVSARLRKNQVMCKTAESGEASDEAGMVSLLNFKLRMTA